MTGTGPKLFSSYLFTILTLAASMSFAQDTAAASVYLKVFPETYTVLVDNEPWQKSPVSDQRSRIDLPSGDHLITLDAEGYRPKTLFLQVGRERILLEEKLERTETAITRFAQLQTGRQPKSVLFSPDGKLIFTALLDGSGIQVFSAEDYQKVKDIIFPEPYGSKRGFVEMAYLQNHGELWVSQMTTGLIHAVDLGKLEYAYSVPTRGLWPKVIAVDDMEEKAYVSNWVSKDISVIDITSRKTTGLIPVGGTPRGLAFSVDQSFLYVCLYDTGNVEKIDLSKEEVVAQIGSGDGSKRHIVLDRKKNIFYVSDMYWGCIYLLSGETDTFIRKVAVDYNPNTIALTSDGAHLIVSSRGPNHPETYLRKGPKFGRIYSINTATLMIEDWIWGKNQPTGLAVSPDDRFFAYSNFLDGIIEVYWTGYDF